MLSFGLKVEKIPYSSIKMLYPAPAAKANELIDYINSMIETGIDDLKITKIRREATKLKEAGFFVESMQLQGMLAAFNADADEVDRLFSAAQKASGNNSLILLNYAVSLSNLRSYRKAIEVVAEARRRNPNDVITLFESLRMSIEAFNVCDAMDLVDQLAKLGKDVSKMDDSFLPKLAAKTDIMVASKATWEEVCDRIKLVSNVLTARGFRPMTCPITESVGDGAMLYEFNLPTDAKGAAEAEDAIIEAIANQPHSNADNAIVFYCLPA